MGEKGNNSRNDELIKAHKKIGKLEKLFAQEIQKVADLLKENRILEVELEDLKCRCDKWRKYYERLNRRKIPVCDRRKAMVIHGELTVGEASGH